MQSSPVQSSPVISPVQYTVMQFSSVISSVQCQCQYQCQWCSYNCDTEVSVRHWTALYTELHHWHWHWTVQHYIMTSSMTSRSSCGRSTSTSYPMPRNSNVRSRKTSHAPEQQIGVVMPWTSVRTFQWSSPVFTNVQFIPTLPLWSRVLLSAHGRDALFC